LAAVFACTLAVGPRAGAAVITLDYNVIATGGTPTGGTPWMTATVTDVMGGVTLSITPASTLSASEFVGRMYFNIVGFTPNPPTNISFVSGPIGTPTFGSPPPPAPGPAGGSDFTLLINFPTANSPAGNRLEAGETALISISGVTTADFLANSAGFITVAHFQGIPPNGDSSWVGNGPPGGTGGNGGGGANVVPEPVSVVAFAVVGGLGAVGVRLRRKKVA
jgi:hypothetical protein